MRHETAIFGPEKPKSRIFIACFLRFEQQKAQKIVESPTFIVF